MEQRKNFSEKLEAFFAGKGFYIVLLLSAAVIGTSVWLMVAGSRADVEDGTAAEQTDIAQAAVAEEPQAAEEPAVATMEETDAAVPAPEAPAVEQTLPETAETAASPAEEPDQAAQTQADYFIWPVSGPVERGYSVETLSYDRTMSDWRTHEGWDIGAELGAQVLAAANGTVSAVYEDDLYGTVVEIDHGSGLVSVYANLESVPTVHVGDTVSVGQVIGAVGTTALGEIGEAGHLHFAMRLDGVSADPGQWLPER